MFFIYRWHIKKVEVDIWKLNNISLKSWAFWKFLSNTVKLFQLFKKIQQQAPYYLWLHIGSFFFVIFRQHRLRSFNVFWKNEKKKLPEFVKTINATARNVTLRKCSRLEFIYLVLFKVKFKFFNILSCNLIVQKTQR